MRTEYLEYLVEVIDCGSMSKAAKKLYLTQPAISNAISSLEEEIGWPIVERTTNGVKATTKGALVVDDARVITKMIRDWNNFVVSKEQMDEIVGDAYIADTGEIGLTYFQDIVTELNKRYPKLVIHIVNPYNTLQQLNNGRFSIAIVPIIPSHHQALGYYLDHYRWKQQTLYQQEYQLLLSPDSSLANKDKISLNDLAGQTILLHPQFPYQRKLTSIEDSSTIICESAIKIVTDVAMNNAVALFPPTKDNMIEAYKKAGLMKFRTIQDLSMPVEYDLIFSEYFSMTSAGKLIIQTIIKCIDEFQK